ncbi:hypothetical protein J31TS4_28540 [Paenibacillus sp. J31TS4]|uniref:hypothetical protein n=1 Tax=Paenibacillus sp. J31TS4 TaxID=2807195 RepID=UPI001B0BFB12|nr:hypothetical protein [Paenibacillus sp. J31TS4]GIP39574.1 hypothetical protein J31TS4_28540 [Paenibacillus sp. J31TS4]
MKRLAVNGLFLCFILGVGIFLGLDAASKPPFLQSPEVREPALPAPGLQQQARQASHYGDRMPAGTPAPAGGTVAPGGPSAPAPVPAPPAPPAVYVQIQDSFLNRLLDKAGDAVSALAKLGLRLVVSAIDSLLN